ncbi:MAG TPA: discoidin domain-containing protein, partial [Acidimicrobiia bacterium]|nr:discoidin domain-containing protein [Acidimicrobiia bacterium]
MARLMALLMLVAACSGGDEPTTSSPTIAPTSTVATSTSTTSTTAAPRDLAAGAAARASGALPGFGAAAAIDGDSSTWWGAGDYPPQWIELDFGAEVTITSLALTVSQDPPGQTIHQIAGNGVVLETVTRSTTDMDVVRIVPAEPWSELATLRVSTEASPSWVGWREIEVLGFVTGPAPAAAPEVIFTGGPILTMSDLGTVEALAVSGEMITAVGDAADILAAAGPDTRVIDLDGRALLPGFVDPHTHILNDAWRIDLDTLGGQQVALENGITTLANMYTPPEFLTEMRDHGVAGELRARVSLYLIATDNCGNDQGDWWTEVLPTRNAGELLRIGGVKAFLDGGTCGEWATTEEIEPGGGASDVFVPTSGLVHILDEANRLGHQVVFHSIGDVATLTALEAIMATTDTSNPLRHRVDHMTIVTDDVIARFGESGAVGVVFGFYPSCLDLEVTQFFTDNARRHQDL